MSLIDLAQIEHIPLAQLRDHVEQYAIDAVLAAQEISHLQRQMPAVPMNAQQRTAAKNYALPIEKSRQELTVYQNNFNRYGEFLDTLTLFPTRADRFQAMKQHLGSAHNLRVIPAYQSIAPQALDSIRIFEVFFPEQGSAYSTVAQFAKCQDNTLIVDTAVQHYRRTLADTLKLQ